MRPAWRWTLALALLALSGCVPAALGSGPYAPFAVGLDVITAAPGQTVYASKTYDEHKWILRTVIDSQGNILEHLIKDLGYVNGPTWSQTPDGILNDLLANRECGFSDREFSSLLMYFYLRPLQVPPGWKVDLQTQEVLQCGPLSKNFDFLPPRGRVTIIERPITTFYRLNYKISLPQGARPGQYALQVQPNDPHSGQSVTENLPVTVP